MPGARRAGAEAPSTADAVPSGITPVRALQVSLAVAFASVGLKALAWSWTGSVGYLSDALESLVNVAGASFALAMVRYAGKPPDRNHPFGHGKAEYFAAAFEGAMIFVAAIAIIGSAAERLVHPQPLERLGAGAALSLLATALNAAAAWLLLRVGRTHRSPALQADARHLITDVWTTAGVIAGVYAAQFSGIAWLDPAVAIVVGLNIVREGWVLMSRSASGLMDRALDDADLDALQRALAAFDGQGHRLGPLRTRVAGARHFAEVDVEVPGGWTVRRAHDLADRLEQAARDVGVTLTTHVEPAADGAADGAADVAGRAAGRAAGVDRAARGADAAGGPPAGFSARS